MDLFEVIKAMFEREYYKVTDEDKTKNFFMVRRMLCGAFPYQTNMLNVNYVDPILGMDTLALLTSKYNKVPYWIFGKKGSTKTVKTKPKNVFDRSKYDGNTIQEVLDSLKIDMKDLEMLYQADAKAVDKIISFVDSIVNETNKIQIEHT